MSPYFSSSIDGIVDATTPEGRYLLSRVGPVRASPFRFRLHSSEVKFWWNPFTHGEAPHFQTRLKSVTCQKRAQDFDDRPRPRVYETALFLEKVKVV